MLAVMCHVWLRGTGCFLQSEFERHRLSAGAAQFLPYGGIIRRSALLRGAGVFSCNQKLWTIRNDNDEAVKLNLKRIRLLVMLDPENKQELEALTADDVADAVMLRQNGKDPTARRLPIPLPISRPKPERDKNWEEFHGDCQNAGIPSGVIGAHSTMEGLVYFDLRGEWDLLQTARLYVPDLERMTSKQAISYFDIDFSRGPEN